MAIASETGHVTDPTPGGTPRKARMHPDLIKEIEAAMTQIIHADNGEAPVVTLNNGGRVGKNKAGDGVIISLPLPA